MEHSVITVTLNPALDKTILLDRLSIGKLNRVKDIRIDLGGKGINVSKVLKQFNIQSLATGFIAGERGNQWLNQLKQHQQLVDFYPVPGEIRTNLKIVDQHTNTTTEINEPGFEVTSKHLTLFKEQLEKHLQKRSILVIGGSLPAGAPASIYRDLIHIAHRHGAKTILDADGPALKEGIKAKPFAIKPNIFELEQLVERRLNTEEEIIAVGKQLINTGISLVMISRGKKGAIVLNEEKIIVTTPFEIIPKSTVGAGDSMVAAMIYAMQKQKNLEELALIGTTAGTITASKPGTQFCTLSEVLDAMQQTKSLSMPWHGKL